MLDSLTAEDFRAHIGETYRLVPLEADATAPVEAELVSVTGHPAHEGSPRAPFDIVFRAPADTGHGQGMFRLEHDEVDALELFVVPIGPQPGSDGIHYQAVFG
jgi:hypothetical protein